MPLSALTPWDSGIVICIGGPSQSNGTVLHSLITAAPFMGRSPLDAVNSRVLVTENLGAGATWGVGVWQPCTSFGISAIIDAIQARFPQLPISVIVASRNGSTIDDWLNGDQPSQIYGQFISQFKLHAPKCIRVFNINIQGESDPGMPTATYMAKHDIIRQNILNDLGRSHFDLTTVVCKIAIGGGTSPVQLAHTALATTRSGCIYGGSLEGKPTGDGTHLDVNGAQQMGDEIGNAIAHNMLGNKLIERKIAATSAEIVFNAGIDAAEEVEFRLRNVIPSNADSGLWLDLGDAAGIKSGATDYTWVFDFQSTSGYSPCGNGYNMSRILCVGNGGGTGITNTKGVNGWIRLRKSAGMSPRITWSLEYINAGGDSVRVSGSAAYVGSAINATQIRFRLKADASTGTIASGTIEAFKIS